MLHWRSEWPLTYSFLNLDFYWGIQCMFTAGLISAPFEQSFSWVRILHERPVWEDWDSPYSVDMELLLRNWVIVPLNEV